MKICVVGTGYVGLVSGVCLASKGHTVTCVDTNLDIVQSLNEGVSTIYEIGLPELLRKVRLDGSFGVTQSISEGLLGAQVVVIAVGTPSRNGQIDLRYVKEVSEIIGSYLATSPHFVSVIVKSTVIPGTTDTVIRKILEKNSLMVLGDFGLGMNPEFLREGQAVDDFMNPDRIVLGYETSATLAHLKELYLPWDVDKIYVNSRTAEFIKYANNVLLATQISMSNELANLAKIIGDVDFMDVVNGIQLDRRWNPPVNGVRLSPGILSYLVPGCGFGGSCFPKDLLALRGLGSSLGAKVPMMSAVIDTNNNQAHQVFKILEDELTSLRGKTVLLLGLAFKVGTDDVRESPAIKIAKDLINGGSIVLAHDPMAVDNFTRIIGPIGSKIEFLQEWEDKISRLDAIVLITPWEEYKSLKLMSLKGIVFFDARRFFDSRELDVRVYTSIGYNPPR